MSSSGPSGRQRSSVPPLVDVATAAAAQSPSTLRTPIRTSAHREASRASRKVESGTQASSARLARLAACSRSRRTKNALLPAPLTPDQRVSARADARCRKQAFSRRKGGATDARRRTSAGHPASKSRVPASPVPCLPVAPLAQSRDTTRTGRVRGAAPARATTRSNSSVFERPLFPEPLHHTHLQTWSRPPGGGWPPRLRDRLGPARAPSRANPHVPARCSRRHDRAPISSALPGRWQSCSSRGAAIRGSAGIAIRSYSVRGSS